MIDFVIRYCGYGEYLALIKATDSGEELYRGGRHALPEDALEKALAVWEEDQTGNIVDFKQRHGL